MLWSLFTWQSWGLIIFIIILVLWIISLFTPPSPYKFVGLSPLYLPQTSDINNIEVNTNPNVNRNNVIENNDSNKNNNNIVPIDLNTRRYVAVNEENITPRSNRRYNKPSSKNRRIISRSNKYNSKNNDETVIIFNNDIYNKDNSKNNDETVIIFNNDIYNKDNIIDNLNEEIDENNEDENENDENLNGNQNNEDDEIIPSLDEDSFPFPENTNKSLMFYTSKNKQGKTSIGEELTCQIFGELLNDPDIQHNIRPPFLTNPKTKKPLELDCWSNKYAMGAEYNGIQHYQFPSVFIKSEAEFEEQIFRDEIKRTLASKNDIPIITIPCLVDSYKFNEKKVTYTTVKRSKEARYKLIRDYMKAEMNI